MPKSSYIKSILASFTSMDIGQLRLKLKDEYTYQETTKEVFLKEVEAVFEAHRNSGDTRLALYPGECAGKHCDNCGNKGYRLVGNHSGNYMDLLFETESDDIKDICCCSEFKTDEEIHGLGEKAELYFNPDELASFHKTPEYIANVEAALSALSEIITTPPTTIDLAGANRWLETHKEIYGHLDGAYDFAPLMKWSHFLWLYSELKAFTSFVAEFLSIMEEANGSIREKTNEDEIVAWMLKYEAVYQKKTFMLDEVDGKQNFVRYTSGGQPLLLGGPEFTVGICFVDTYRKHNGRLLEKYSIFTRKEESEMLNKSDLPDVYEDIYSLSYHLNVRSKLEAAGIHIPFYLKHAEDRVM